MIGRARNERIRISLLLVLHPLLAVCPNCSPVPLQLSLHCQKATIHGLIALLEQLSGLLIVFIRISLSPPFSQDVKRIPLRLPTTPLTFFSEQFLKKKVFVPFSLEFFYLSLVFSCSDALKNVPVPSLL